MSTLSDSCCCTCWINLFPCCFDTQVEKDISHNALNNIEPSISKRLPPRKIHSTQNVHDAIALDKKLKAKRHVKLSSTDILTAQSALKMNDIEYQAYLKRNLPNTLTSKYKTNTPTRGL